METVATLLRGEGHIVTLYEVDALLEDKVSEDVIFSMARGETALQKLECHERSGSVVVNSPQGVRNCHRLSISRLINESGANVPPYLWFDLSADLDIPHYVDFPCWLKRSDASAQEPDDVCFVIDEAHLKECLATFRKRKISEALISRHVEGDIVKFYGVAGSSFFNWRYPTLNGKQSKFGLEVHNGPVQQYAFSVLDLKKHVDYVALQADVAVYGGDCVVDSSGKCWIIDFNDWPSFSSCIDKAAEAIVALVLKKCNCE